VFDDEKALLKHMLAVHFRDDENEAGIRADWPSDVRQGDLRKCGCMVWMNGTQMQNIADNLLVPRQTRITVASVTCEISLMPGARASCRERQSL